MLVNNKIINKSKWVNGLDSLRFFLALIVLLSHMPNPIAISLKNSNNIFLQSLGKTITPMYCGIGAVIAFFIISGFVIHYPNKNKEFSVFKFLLRRWVRLGIPLLVVVIISSYYNLFSTIPIWSLYCELIFYTIYPVLKKIKINFKYVFVFSFVVALILISTLAFHDIISLVKQKNINFSGGYWQLGDFLTWIIGLPCWLLGVILADQIDNFSYDVSTKKIFLYRISIFLISIVIQLSRFKFYLSWIISMNFFAFVLFIWIRNEIIYYRNHQPSRFFEKLGKFSYSLYITHGFLYMIISFVLIFNFATYFLYIFLIIFMSYIVYLLIEKPSHLFAQYLGADKKTK